jgi:hypothetical protein
MIIVAIALVSLALLILFFAVTTAGGRAPDRTNGEAARRRIGNGEPQDGR